MLQNKSTREEKQLMNSYYYYMATRHELGATRVP